MKKIALAAAAVMLASSASVVGLEHGNIPMPRRRPTRAAPDMTAEELQTYAAEREATKAAANAERDRKLAAAKAKRERKGKKLAEVAAKGGIDTVVVKEGIVAPEPVKPKRSRAKKTTTI